MNRRALSTMAGAGILTGVGGVVLYNTGGKTLSTLHGSAGGEKMDLLRSPEFLNILKNAGMESNIKRLGSLEMINTPVNDTDFLWPAHDFVTDQIKKSAKIIAEDNVFSSPLVILSWDTIVDRLEKINLITKTNNSYIFSDISSFIDQMIKGKTWKDLGVDLFGSLSIMSTHPKSSNSGLMYAALLATILAKKVPSHDDLNTVGPIVKRIFDAMGRLEDSSGRIFSHFLSQGKGAYPMIIAYENQIIEYFLGLDASDRKRAMDQIKIIYPNPTFNATHPLLAFRGNGKLFLELLKSKEVQSLASLKNGFRTLSQNFSNLPGVLPRVSNVAPMPSSNFLLDLMDQYIPVK